MELDVLTSSYLELRKKLHFIAMKYLNSDAAAEDALQDTWLKLKTNDNVETSVEAKRKLVVVLRNVCIDHLRKNREISIDSIPVNITLGYQEEVENINNLEKILLECLTPLQRQIFCLITHEGYDYEQIAESLSMSVEAVRMNLSRTRKKIRETYKKLNNEA